MWAAKVLPMLNDSPMTQGPISVGPFVLRRWLQANSTSAFFIFFIAATSI